MRFVVNFCFDFFRAISDSFVLARTRSVYARISWIYETCECLNFA